MRSVERFASALAFALALGGTLPAEAESESGAEAYSPWAGEAHPTRVYWGDTHLHTKLSVDAAASGALTLGPEEAYRVARGEEVTSSHGQRVRLSRPLDFLVIADHAEYLGLLERLEAGDPALGRTPAGARWLAMYRAGGEERAKVAFELLTEGLGTAEAMQGAAVPTKAPALDPSIPRSVWQQVAANADRFDAPGSFTAFIGYEWTSMPEIDNLHRVVVFRDDASRAAQMLPYTALDGEDPEGLWRHLAEYERRTGGQALAIPHNSNASNGRMFATNDFRGAPFTATYARTRARWEPLVEVTQIKGDSETHPALSPNDEFAGYETWDRGNLLFSKRKEAWMLRYDYVRSALGLGLAQQALLGENPFRMGMIGSSDAHTGIPAVEEDNFFGKVEASEPSPERWRTLFFQGKTASMENWQLASSGYAAIWATANTREALFDAMRRRETYASTGPRITVRIFGGWDFEPADATRPELARIGYRRGVPMGGELARAPRGRAPRFLIQAAKDPIGANLDRVQVVKGWLDGRGEPQERVFDVALSNHRALDAQGKAPPVGATVDVAAATYRNTIGAAELSTVWEDPAFDARQLAFYYARVIEIPTPRWTAYDAKRFGVTMDPKVPMTTQERAYTSPIWYTP